MINVKVGIDGIGDVQGMLMKMNRFAENGDMNLMNNVAKHIAVSIKNRINLQSRYHSYPERTNNLSTSVYGAVVSGKEGIVASDLFYAPYVEYGTKGAIVGKGPIPIHPKPLGSPVLWRTILYHKATRPKRYFELGLSDYLNGNRVEEDVGNEIIKKI